MPAITSLPTPAPSRTMIDAVYVPAADALMGALPQLVAEINVAVTAMNNNSTNATSTTALSVGAGTKSLTVQTGKSYVVGQSLKIASSASPSNHMIGYVTAYTAETGALVVTVTQYGGSGTIAAWTVTLAVEGVLSRVVLNGATSGSITIEAPAVAGSGTLTLPVATDTLVGRATTDTLSNKTLVAPVLGIPVSGDLTSCTATTAASATSTTQLATTAFAFGTLSNAANGYMKLPNGMILQWFQSGNLTDFGGLLSTTVSYPIAFPTAVRQVFISYKTVSGNGPDAMTGWWNPTAATPLSVCTITYREVGAVTQGTFNLIGFAIGN